MTSHNVSCPATPKFNSTFCIWYYKYSFRYLMHIHMLSGSNTSTYIHFLFLSMLSLQ